MFIFWVVNVVNVVRAKPMQFFVLWGACWSRREMWGIKMMVVIEESVRNVRRDYGVK